MNLFIYWGTVGSSALFFVMVLTSVFSRYVFKTPVLQAVEVSRLAFVWACFLGAAVAHQRRCHIAISVVTDRLPSGLQVLVNSFVQLLTFAVGSVLFFYAVQVAWILRASVLPILDLSQAWFYAPVIIASFSIALTSLEQLRSTLMSKKERPHDNVT